MGLPLPIMGLVGGGCTRCVCFVQVFGGGREEAGAGRRRRRRRCGGRRELMSAGGPGVGFLAGNPWREAQQSLMLSGSEREAAWGKREGGGRTERRVERDKKGYLWISLCLVQKGSAWRVRGRGKL